MRQAGKKSQNIIFLPTLLNSKPDFEVNKKWT